MIVLAVFVSPRIKLRFLPYRISGRFVSIYHLFTDFPLNSAAEKVCVIKWDSDLS
jgi:hypothetical protein